MIDIINLIANIASIIGAFIGIYAVFYASKIAFAYGGWVKP